MEQVDSGLVPGTREFTDIEERSELVKIGQWYWVHKEDDDNKWLGCVVKVGSNYLKLHSVPDHYRSYHVKRVHFDNFYETLTLENNAPAYIQTRIDHYQNKVNKQMDEVNKITSRLGFVSQTSISHDQNSGSDNANQSLAILSTKPDVDGYKTDLIKAKEEDLPTLFKKIEISNKKLASWMIAETIPIQATGKNLEGVLEHIEDRIFNVSIYAGLTESIISCSDGEPAAYSEKLHVLQRRTYMDEECLLSYRSGGMSFSNINEFDQWISEPENRDRILPFPRCMVAMKVRRNEKYRTSGGSTLQAFINIEKARADNFTYLYLRNGDRVSRIVTEMDLGALIFPGRTIFNPSEPKMVKMRGSSVDQMISIHDYDERLKASIKKKENYDQWFIDNPFEQWIKDNRQQNEDNDKWWWERANPFESSRFGFDQNHWAPFDPSNVYYDDCVEEIDKKIKEYNRIALIIQGIFDRSEALHPHPQVKSWTPEGFAAAIELVYDGSNVLHYKDAPDFEAYRLKCNALINEYSITIGQDDYWLKKEAAKECNRRDNDYRDKSDYRPEHFRPEGNNGPGYIARLAKWKPRAKKATFIWRRERLRGGFYGSTIRTTITVPADKLFNVSAYKLGDFKQFFQDPRTRAKYLKWAPMLLAAEEYHSGNETAKEPVE